MSTLRGAGVWALLSSPPSPPVSTNYNNARCVALSKHQHVFLSPSTMLVGFIPGRDGLAPWLPHVMMQSPATMVLSSRQLNISLAVNRMAHSTHLAYLPSTPVRSPPLTKVGWVTARKKTSAEGEMNKVYIASSPSWFAWPSSALRQPATSATTATPHVRQWHDDMTGNKCHGAAFQYSDQSSLSLSLIAPCLSADARALHIAAELV